MGSPIFGRLWRAGPWHLFAVSSRVKKNEGQTMLKWVVTAAVLGIGLPALAEVIDEKEAKKQLFSPRGYGIEVSRKLSAEDQATVKAIVPLMAKQLRQPVRYYAAIAYSPDDGLVHEALQAAMNYHTPGAAAAAAIAACNTAKSRNAQKCQVAAQVVPKKYKPRELTLSLDATVGFSKAYRRAKAPKSLAISRTDGNWGMGKSDAAALKTCSSGAAASDCEIVIRD